MSASSVLARGRKAIEALMVDSCTVTRQTGSHTDDLTGQVTPTYVTRYTGKCRVQAGGGQGQDAEAGEMEPVLIRVELQLPVATSTGIARGDLVTITSATHDADLAGRVFRVQDLFHKTHDTSRRIQIRETT